MREPIRRCCIVIVLSAVVLCDAGLIKGRRNKHDESVETLLAVGLIAKALADSESPRQETQCPPPVQVTRVVHVPVHKDRIIFLKDKHCDGKVFETHESKDLWGTSIPPPTEPMEMSWK